MSIAAIPGAAPAGVADPSPRVEAGADELLLLAEACEELEAETADTLAAWCADDAGRPDGVRTMLGHLGERFEALAMALRFIGLGAVAGLLEASCEQIGGLAADPVRADLAVRRALRAWPRCWAQAFRTGSRERIRVALVVHAAAGLGDAARSKEAMAQWCTVRRVPSRKAGPPRLASGDMLPAALDEDLDHALRATLVAEMRNLAGEATRLAGGDPAALRDAERALHTLKGTAITAGAAGVAQLAHALEDFLALVPAAGDSGTPGSPETDRRRALLVDALDGLSALVEASAAGASCPPESVRGYRALVAMLARDDEPAGAVAGPSPDEGSHRPRVQPGEPSRSGDPVDVLARRLEQAVREASRLAGRPADLVVEGRAEAPGEELLQALAAALEHLVRNAIDHGIEPALQRERAGKPARGRIVIRFERPGGGLARIACEDDGRGMTSGTLRRLAARHGLADVPVDDPEWLARLLCTPGLTTAERPGMLSGRGLGLAAAAAAVERQGGWLRIEAGRPAGLRVTVLVPLASPGGSDAPSASGQAPRGRSDGDARPPAGELLSR